MEKAVGVYPERVEVEHFIKELNKKTTDIVNDDGAELWAKHNAYSTYCVILLMHLTCHRPVRDPFWTKKHINIEDGLILINDKAVDNNREFRLVSLPELAVEQLTEYWQYLHALSAVLKETEIASKEISAAVYSINCPGKQKIPQVFIRDCKLKKTQSISTKTVKSYTRDIGWFAENFGRKNYATELLQKHGWAPMVEIQLGHMDSLLNPFGKVSEIVPLSILNEMGLVCNKVMTSLGWSVIPSYLKRKKGPVYDLSSNWFDNIKVHENNRFGEEYRKITRDAVSKKYAD